MLLLLFNFMIITIIVQPYLYGDMRIQKLPSGFIMLHELSCTKPCLCSAGIVQFKRSTAESQSLLHTSSFACLSIGLFVCPLSHRLPPSTHPFAHCCVCCLPACLPACLPVCLSVCLSVCPSFCLFACWRVPSINPSTQPSIHATPSCDAAETR